MGYGLPIKPDWAHLVDLLRRRHGPITIDLTCTIPAASALGRDGFDSHPMAGSTGVVPTTHRQAAEFFLAATMAATPSPSPLAIHLSLHSDEPVDDVLATVIGRHILGLTVKQERVPSRKSVIFPPDIGKLGVVGHPEELIRAFHPPYGHIEGRGLTGHRATRLPMRFKLPQLNDAAAIGAAYQQGSRTDVYVPVSISPADRLRHVYIVGKTGSGKTNFLKNLIRQDIELGHGVGVIDPHGGLVDYLLRHVGKRVEDTILLDFSDPEYLPALNPLLIDTATESDRILAVEELIDIIVRRSFNQFTGPVFDDTVRMILDTASAPHFRDIAEPSVPIALELFRNSETRKKIPSVLAESDALRAQWQTFNSMLPTTIGEHARWVLAKFSEFGATSFLFPVAGAGASGLSLRNIFHERKILLVKIPEATVGRRAAEFIGALIFSRLHRAARETIINEVKPFYLHVDEFQKFVTVEIEELVAEARKFNLSLTLAHQNLRQLEAFSRYEGTSSGRLGEAIFSNVGTLICLRTSGRDVVTLAQELDVRDASIRRLNQYDGLARCVIAGVERETFTLNIPDAEIRPGDERAAAAVRRHMIAVGHWRRRDDLEKSASESINRIKDSWQPRPSAKQGEARTLSHAASFQNQMDALKRQGQQMEEEDIV